MKNKCKTLYAMKRVVEPVRKSLLDVIRKNLRATGKVRNLISINYHLINLFKISRIVIYEYIFLKYFLFHK